MNIVSIKDQVELIASAAIGGGTTVAAYNIDKLIETSTPYIRFLGTLGGVILTFILCGYWIIKTKNEKRKTKNDNI